MWQVSNWLLRGQKCKTVSLNIRKFSFREHRFSCRGDDKSFKKIKNGIGLGYGCQKTIDDDVVGPSAFEPIMNASVPFETPRKFEDLSARIVGGQKAVPHR